MSSADGVVVVPAFSGLGAPHWNPYARGTIFGITRGTTDAHIARATLESIAYQTYDVLKAMESDAGLPIAELRVDGGATVNDLLMQFQSDILSVKVLRPEVIETTALGAAYLAGLAVGFWNSVEAISSQWKVSELHRARVDEDEGLGTDSAFGPDALPEPEHPRARPGRWFDLAVHGHPPGHR